MSAALMDFDVETMSIREDLPRQHRATRLPRVETYSYIASPKAPTSYFPPLLPLFGFEVEGSTKLLSQPLLLRVAVEDGEFFVENGTLRLFGNGGTLAEAVRAFAHDLAYFWAHYRSLREDEVAGEGAVMKRRYEDLVAD